MELSKKDSGGFDLAELAAKFPLMFMRQLEIKIDAHGADYETVKGEIENIFKDRNGDCQLRLKISNVGLKKE